MKIGQYRSLEGGPILPHKCFPAGKAQIKAFGLWLGDSGQRRLKYHGIFDPLGIVGDDGEKKVYGSSSEQTKEELVGQLSLVFNEAEAYQPKDVPVRETTVAEHTRKKPEARATERLPENVPAVIPGSFASPEAIAWIMVQKFVMASPLYRLGRGPSHRAI